MSAGTILLIAVAVLIMVIMYRVADGVHGTADVAPVAGRGADTEGEPSRLPELPKAAWINKPDTEEAAH